MMRNSQPHSGFSLYKRASAIGRYKLASFVPTSFDIKNGLVTAWFALTVLLLGACSDGKTVALADGGSLNLHNEKIVVINYWAKWCKPCRHEIPELNRLNEHSGITVIGVDFDKHQGSELTDLVREMNIEFPVLQGDLSPSVIHPELSRQAKALPMTYLLEATPGSDLADDSPVKNSTKDMQKRMRLSKVLLGPQTEAGLLKKIDVFKNQ